jgi:putative transposase
VRINHRIDEIYTAAPFSGSRRMTAHWQREGMESTRKAVQRHRHEMGIEAIFPGPHLSRRRRKEQVSPSLLRKLTVTSPHHVWGRDITSLRMQRGWMDVVALLDWYSRSVVRWEREMTLEMPFVVRAVQRALAQAVPLICPSDQGSHFPSPQSWELLWGAKVQSRMDGKGRAGDNIFPERVWRSVKQEEVSLPE